jgi:uncharacterized cupredoxin-like copper-binding protein
MRKTLAGAVLVLALAGCGSSDDDGPQAVTVTAGDRDCEVNPTDVGVGDVEFTVNNTTGQRVPFSVKEDDDTNQVGEVDVDPNGTAKLSVHFDGGDEYQLHCGAVNGPLLTPR